MYTNFCIFQEDVSDPNPLKHLLAPRPPCRSFCVQVSQVVPVTTPVSHKLYLRWQRSVLTT